jgi:hypothetical protein
MHCPPRHLRTHNVIEPAPRAGAQHRSHVGDILARGAAGTCCCADDGRQETARCGEEENERRGLVVLAPERRYVEVVAAGCGAAGAGHAREVPFPGSAVGSGKVSSDGDGGEE